MSLRPTRIAAALLAGLVPFLMAAPVVTAAPGVGETRMYVLVHEIPGESTDQSHTDWIDAFGLTYGLTHCIDPTQGAGGPCGPVVFTDVSFLKLTDLSTPPLHARLVAGQSIPEVTIEVCAAPGGGPQMCYYRVKLVDVFVTSLDLAGSACADPANCGGGETESVSLSFRQIEWTFTRFVDGEPQGDTVTCWDKQANGPC